MLMLPDSVILHEPVSDDAVGLYRIAAGAGEGVFRDSSDNLRLRVAHAYGKRQRSLIRVDYSAIVADPLLSTVNRPESMSFQLVLDVPRNGGFAVGTIEEFPQNICRFLLGDGVTDGYEAGASMLGPIILGES